MRAAAFLGLLVVLSACSGDSGGDGQGSERDLAFMVNRDGWGEIWVMTRNGTKRQRLTDPPQGDAAGAASPDWSPDGSKIVFAGQLGTAEENLSLNEIYTMNSDGSDQRQLTANRDYDADPAWSPDGDQIAFTRVTGVDSGHPRGGIVLMDAEGGGERQITRSGTLDLDGTPAWSPDGFRIVFTRGSFEPGSEAPETSLFSVKPDGTGLERISEEAGEASFSPDGRRIVFTSTRDRFGRTCFQECSTNSEIYVMNADGSGQRRLTRSKADDRSPVWSPDGSVIAFVSDRSNPEKHENEIYLMNPNGGGLRRITRNEVWDLEPAWRLSG